jgi:hypothetical protein
MKRRTFLMVLFFLSARLYGQHADTTSRTLQDFVTEPVSQTPEPPLPATAQYSSEEITVRKFDEKKWHKIVDSRNYADKRTRNTPDNEKQGNKEPGRNSETRAKDDGEDTTHYSYDDDSETLDMSWLGPVGQIIFYLAIATIIVVILVQVIRTTSFKSNPKRKRSTLDGADDGQDITLLDTEDLILKAHNARNYKLAIRLHFLDLLKKLNENGFITWTKDKTNRDYLSELFSKQYYFEEIRKLTLAYEQVWYGEHSPSEDRYQELRGEFQGIDQKFRTS